MPLCCKPTVDDSSTSDGSVLVLAGLIADAKSWVTFSQEWDHISILGCALPTSMRIAYFKMSEAAGLGSEFAGWREEVRDERIKLLSAVILLQRSLKNIGQN